MSSNMKRRMITASGFIIIAIIIVAAIVGSSTAASTISVAQAADGSYNGKKVQVTGNVTPNSYSTEGNTLYFSIYDPDNTSDHIEVVYDGAASSTFGNDVTAICTGRMEEGGTLQCSELVTKCPSKYESATNALSVSQLMGYGDNMKGTMVKLTGQIVHGSLNPAGSGDRFILADPESGTSLAISYDGALSDDINDDSTVVLTGSLNDEGSFTATEVALEE